jgi:hypothetical protein
MAAMKPTSAMPFAASVLLAGLALPLASAATRETPGASRVAAPDVGAYAQRITTQSLLGVTITNYGYVGNNFSSRSASFEYPAGAGYEHMVNGGLWIGARAVDASGPFTGVTTAVLDMGVGPTSPGATEFTPIGTAIQVRSKLPSSPFFSPDAVSEQDFVSEYDDLTPRQAAGNPEPHRPLGVQVRQENYSWTLPGYEHALFFHYVIKNLGPPLTDAWVGFYSELASGWKAGYVNWPPSSSDPGGLGGWYSKKWIAYDAPQRLFREHYCRSLPIPAGCNLALVPYWVGIEQLGARPGGFAIPGDKRVTVAAWSWSPGSVFRDQDIERYAIMSAGTIQPLSGDSLQPTTGDPVELIAVGPFPQIATGDSIAVDFALVGGSQITDLQNHAMLAQYAYDMGYAFLPTPVQISLVDARAEPGVVRLSWLSPAGAAFAGTVWRSEPGGEWTSIGDVVSTGTGRIEYEDRSVRAGARYGYRLSDRGASSTTGLGEAWIDVPSAAGFALWGLKPNPASARDLAVSFSLESAAPATLELLDVGGRRVLARAVGALGAGNHVLPLEGGGIAPGTYFIRLTQGARSATRRAVVTR